MIDDVCEEAIDRLSRIGFYFIVTETVMHELADIVELDADPESRHYAKVALNQITSWAFLQSQLSPIQMGICEQVARELIHKFIPNAGSNDGLVLAEAACNNCRTLITRRGHILDSTRNAIQMALIRADLCGTFVGSPDEWVAVLKEIENGPSK